MSATVTPTSTPNPDTITLDGKEYPLATLELGDYRRLEQWVTRHAWHNAVESMRGVGSPDSEEMRVDALTRLILAGEFKVGSPGFMSAVSSRQGQCEVVVMMVTKANPDVPEQEVRQLVERQHNADWESLWTQLHVDTADAISS